MRRYYRIPDITDIYPLSKQKKPGAWPGVVSVRIVPAGGASLLPVVFPIISAQSGLAIHPKPYAAGFPLVRLAMFQPSFTVPAIPTQISRGFLPPNFPFSHNGVLVAVLGITGLCESGPKQLSAKILLCRNLPRPPNNHPGGNTHKPRQ